MLDDVKEHPLLTQESCDDNDDKEQYIQSKVRTKKTKTQPSKYFIYK